MDCLDCKHCKIIIAKGILRCKEGHWVKGDLSEKIIKLRKEEISSLRITWRYVFGQGQKCHDMEDLLNNHFNMLPSKKI